MWSWMKSWLTGNAFEGQGFVFKLLRFLNLMEDKAVKFSLTGAQMWATTILNIHTQIVAHDHITQGIVAAVNGGAMVAHGIKRGQTIADPNNPQNQSGDEPDALPPWTGESQL